MQLGNGRCEAGEEIPRKLMHEAPRDCHLAFALVPNISGRSKQPEGAIVRCQTHEANGSATLPLASCVW